MCKSTFIYILFLASACDRSIHFNVEKPKIKHSCTNRKRSWDPKYLTVLLRSEITLKFVQNTELHSDSQSQEKVLDSNAEEIRHQVMMRCNSNLARKPRPLIGRSLSSPIG